MTYSGFKYFDNSKSLLPEEKILSLRLLYLGRFNREPSVCYVHRDLVINPELLKGVNLKIIPDNQIFSPHIFVFD